MNHQEILSEIRRLPLNEKIVLAQDTLDIIRRDVDEKSMKTKERGQAYTRLIALFDALDFQLPPDFRFNREEANARR